MRKILNKEYFRGLLTVKIEGLMCKNKIGDIIADENNNMFKIKSVPLISGANVDRENTELIIEPINTSYALGIMLDVD